MHIIVFTDRNGAGKSDSIWLEQLPDAGITYTTRDWREDVLEPVTDATIGIIRSTWDYYKHEALFRDWLEKRAQITSMPLCNSVDLIQGNLSKSYLCDLEQKGIRIVPTLVQDVFDYDEATTQFETTTLVTKPIIGASGYQVEKTISKEYQPPSTPVVVQPFMPEILDGEYSFIFFNGTYSHAVLRIPQGDEFRANVHANPPAVVTKAEPVDSLIEGAAQVVATLPETPLYARVDGIVRDNTLYLLELELIEPSLFFYMAPEKAQLFTDAIKTRV